MADRHRVAEVLVDHEADVPQGDRREAEVPGPLGAGQLRFRGRRPGGLGLGQRQVEIGRLERMQGDLVRAEGRPGPGGADRLPAVGRGGEDRQVVRAGREPDVDRRASRRPAAVPRGRRCTKAVRAPATWIRAAPGRGWTSLPWNTTA